MFTTGFSTGVVRVGQKKRVTSVTPNEKHYEKQNKKKSTPLTRSTFQRIQFSWSVQTVHHLTKYD